MPNLESHSAKQRILWAKLNFPNQMVLTTSGGKTSALLPHLVTSITGHTPPIIFIDTQNYTESTYAMVQKLISLGYPITTHKSQNGNKKQALLKVFNQVKPAIWLRAIRSYQTPQRSRTKILEKKDGIFRLNPVLDWSKRKVNKYIKEHNLPTNPGHFDPAKGKNQNLECGILF